MRTTCTRLVLLTTLAILHPFAAWPGAVSPDEIAEIRQWCAARLQDVACPTSVEPGLFAQANHDAVLKNAHGGQQ